MVIKNVNLETVCGITSKLPDHTLPEIAFAGKSNVGKSSLINAMDFSRLFLCSFSQEFCVYKIPDLIPSLLCLC